MGGLRAKMPVTFWTFVVFTLAISGVPLTSGFLSKDEILAGTLAFGGLTGHVVIPVIGFLVAGLTAFYMFRLVILTFLGEHRDSRRIDHVRESGFVMTLPLLVLAALSVFIFYSTNPFDGASGWIVRAVERPESTVPVSLAAPSAGRFEEVLARVSLTAMLLSLSVAGLGILAAFAMYRWKKISADAVARALSPVHTFLVNKWYFDELYQAVIVNGVLGLSSLMRWVDTWIVDGAVNGAGWVTRGVSLVSGKFDTYVVDGLVNLSAYLSGFFGLVLRKFQTGKIQTYVLFAVLGVMVFYFIFRLV
jgi:NADH-quinone oxidoreductase subunit L